MADPATLTAISLGTTALGALTGAAGSAASGEAGAQMYGYQAGVSRMNQQIAKQNADYSRYVGEVEAQQSGMKTKFQVSSIKDVQAASGLDINSGTGIQVREGQHDIGLQDQAIIRSSAARRAYGFEVEGAQAGAQAGVYDMAARKSRQGGYIGALSSILGGASSVAGKWLDAKKTGIGTVGKGPGPDFPQEWS